MDLNRLNAYERLRFAARQRFPRRLIPILGALVLLALLWRFVAPSVLYWLLLAGVALLVWLASYGWRDALAALRAFIERLEAL